jgi:TolB-like protein
VRPPSLAERGRRFVVLPFRNVARTPEYEWLVEGSTTMLVDALGRWQEITVVPDERLYPALRRHGIHAGSVVDLDQVRRVAEETGGWTVITGEVLASGGTVRVSARAYDAVTNRELVRAAADMPAGGDVRGAFERIGTALLHTAGLDTAHVYLGDVTTRSLDAYRAYLRGVAHLNRAEYRRARVALLEAVAIDSNFAQAWFGLALSAAFSTPAAMFDPSSSTSRYIRRAVELAERLPLRRRDVVLAMGAMFQGRFGAAREILERLVGRDSSDVNAVGWLSLLEFLDPILVPDGAGGERRRGSLNRNARLAKRLLELDPSAHGAYIPLVYGYALAAGDLPGVLPAFRREPGGIEFLLTGVPARVFLPLMLSDSIVLVPAESVSALPRDTLVAARRRALEAATAWANRWVAVGPTEGEAHRALAKVSELAGDCARALAELDQAESLGVELGYQDISLRRLVLLGKLGRYADAARHADSLWTTGRFDRVLIVPGDAVEGFAWAFNLFLLAGDHGRADSALARFAAGLARLGMMPDTTFAAAMATRLLSGTPLPPLWQIELPAAFRMDVVDSIHAHRATLAADSRIARLFPTLAGLAGAAAQADSVLRARLEAAPWFRSAGERRP